MGFRKKKKHVGNSDLDYKKKGYNIIVGCLSIVCPFPLLCCLGNNIRRRDSDHHRIYARRLHHARL